MGFYTSWAAFSVTHHLIIRYCGFVLGKKTHNEYVIIGDDVAIFNEDLAKMYQEIIGLAGVPISLTKSSISRSGDPFRFGEIAKSLITVTGEITPIPAQLVKA